MSEKPEKVTAMPVPTSALAKVPVPALMLTVSPEMMPSIWACSVLGVAVLVPS